MTTLPWRVAWITGASTGIGRELALLLASRGVIVAASARSADKLEALGQGIHAYPLDVTDSQAVADTHERIRRELGAIDLAVLSAGTYRPLDIEHFDISNFAITNAVNYLGVIHALAALVPAMRLRGSGHVAWIASVAGYRGLPKAAAYGPSKAALINLAECLKPELDAVGSEADDADRIADGFAPIGLVSCQQRSQSLVDGGPQRATGARRTRRDQMPDADISYVSAADLAGRVRRKDISPVEVVEGAITLIETRNPSLNALIHLGFEDARREAKRAEDQLMRGEALGPLHGVPAAIKDLFDFKPGWPTTFGGVRALKNNIAQFHCPFAERIEKAGAILVGKTNAPVMGLRGVCDNYLFGATRNPFDTSRNPGGSSGGSAAVVADGILPLAEGTDAGGSIRIPAAWCGVYGYKASYGRVPVVIRPNAFAGDLPFVFEGPITRTVEDAALAMSALDGYDPRDPHSLDEKVDYMAALRRSIRGMRIAYSPDLDVFPVEPAIRDAIARALRAFEDAGAHVEEVKVGITTPQRELSDVWSRLMMPLNLGAFATMKMYGVDLLKDHRDDFPPEYLRWIEIGEKMTLDDLGRDQWVRSHVYDAFQAVFARYDLLVTPTLGAMPVKNRDDGNTLGPSAVNGEEVDPLIGWCLTYPVNFTGHPAASIPAGLVDGLPVGMQIIGRRYADADVFAASAAFEQLRPWQDSYEICRKREL